MEMKAVNGRSGRRPLQQDGPAFPGELEYSEPGFRSIFAIEEFLVDTQGRKLCDNIKVSVQCTACLCLPK